jgi:hypothetical protein
MTRVVSEPSSATKTAEKTECTFTEARRAQIRSVSRTRIADGVAFWRGRLGPVETLLPEGADPKRLRQMPASYRRSYVRTVQGKASPKTAIRLFCLECVGWQRVLAVTCPTRACPLWAMLPRRAEDNVRDVSPAPPVRPT